ncbi:YihY/virulence factor BrkB family protein [Nocardioides sp.]|uniref:YihY/virulence factor BrkB family protein n=1 Tax=Nocardioides sp. TaxID=35761 RepID=UPI003D122738
MALKQQISDRITSIRARRPFIDHLVRMVEHYGTVKGNMQAGAVTYFAFLSFFPILALAFAAVGYVVRIYPDAQEDLVTAINQVLPGFVGNDDGQVSLSAIEDAAGAAIGFGLIGLLVAGLGWLSSMRDALLVVFEKPQEEQPNFVFGKLRDLVAMITLGVVLLLSVAVSGVVTSFSSDILDALDLATGLGWLLSTISILIGLLANMVLFFTFFKLLGAPDAPSRSLWSGALLGAIGFEVLKQASTFLLAATSKSPAFQAFGIALILLVWINYFSRLVMYAAAFAHTSLEARAVREAAEAAEAKRVAATRVDLRKDPAPVVASSGAPVAAFAAGGITALGLIAVLRRRRDS